MLRRLSRCAGSRPGTRGRHFTAWMMAIALAFAQVPAHADGREDSRAAFRRGVALAQGGDFARARDAFLDAYRLFAHPSILLNLGIARWKTGDLPAAEQDLVKFLADDGGASQEDVASARAALAAVRAKLGTVRVRVQPAGARALLDGRPVALAADQFADVRAVVGEHLFDAQADGFAPRRQTVNVDAGRVALVDVSLEAVKERTGGTPAGAGMSTRHVVGWVLVGTGGALGLVGLLAGMRAQALAHDYNSAPPGAQDGKTRSDGVFLRTTADIAFITGIASASVGAYLLLAPDPSKPAGVSAVMGPGFAGIRGHF